MASATQLLESHSALPAPTKTSTSTTTPPKSTINEDLLIRRSHIWEGLAMGRIAALTYLHTPLSAFLAPKRFQYPTHWTRSFRNRNQKRLFSPRNLSFVVVPKKDPWKVVGYAQFVRLGEDEGARRQIESWGLWWRIVLFVMGLCFDVWCWLVSKAVGGDRSEDPEAVKTFGAWSKLEWEKHWEVEGRENRWHAQSVVVSEEYQGRGMGKRLMAEVVGRAEVEGVVVGLESSDKGEGMYRSVEFELLGRFMNGVEEEQNAGGVMMYTPRRMRKVGDGAGR